MPLRRAVGVAVVVALCGCGSSTQAGRSTPTPSPSATASASVTPSPTVCATSVPAGLPPLMAVLERKVAPRQPLIARPLITHDTLAIARLDATARAHASFQPRSSPYIGNAATLLAPREAYVVHGLVYYIDGFGTVWTMGADGRQAVAARFAIGVKQQEVSFAVSPDGCQIVATVLTIPNPGPPPSGEPFPTLKGTWKLETMSATFGGTTQVLHTWTSTDYPNQASTFQHLVLVGWDTTGPLVVVGPALGTQNVSLIDNPDFFGGSVSHLDGQGMPGAAIPMPAGCSPVQATPAGDITCAKPSSDGSSVTLEVVGSTGDVEVQPFTVSGLPDVAAGTGGMIAVTGQWRRGGATGTLPPNFQPEGWIDANTIFGRLGDPQGGSGNALIAHLSGGGSTVENLKFVGDYVGMLAA